MSNAISTTIDRAGRIVVPKSLRERAGLLPGTTVQVRLVDSHLEIETVPADVVLKKRGRWLVATSVQDIGILSAAEVLRVQDSVRNSGDEDDE
jgi:AbrB family looped-hinge helix DNA binding protein